MRLIQNAIGISKLILILLLLVSAIVGAVLSYMWTEGYYQSRGLRLPETATVTITDVAFDPQDPTFFNLILLNPSFSPSSASVAKIMASTEDGVLHGISAVTPSLPVELSIGESKTLKCIWNWANYTGEDIRVYVFIAEGSGSNLEKKAPLVDLTITDVVFNSTISVSHFNMTVQNSASSATYVNITNIMLDTETVQTENVVPSLPYPLKPNSSVVLMCPLNWVDYQGKDVTVTVNTLQGYAKRHTETTPQPMVLNISDVAFNTTDTSYFNVTVENNASSPTHVNVTGVTVTVGNTTEEANVTNLALPYQLNPNSTVLFMCSWNWTSYQGMTAEVTVHTLQEFEISTSTEIPGG
jgi:hypothetical protein